MLRFKELSFSGTFLMLLIFAASQVSAQVTSRTASMSQGVQDAIVLEFPTAEVRMVENLWGDFVKDNYDNRNKRNRRTKEMEALNISIAGVSTSSKVDMYSVVNERGSGSELVVWIASNDGYISPVTTPNRYIEAEKFLLRFALDVARAQMEEQIEEEEKALRDMERDLDRLASDQEKSRREIERARQVIAREETNIEENEAAQETQRQLIETQRQVIQASRDKKNGMR